jgi:hypothetical protein
MSLASTSWDIPMAERRSRCVCRQNRQHPAGHSCRFLPHSPLPVPRLPLSCSSHAPLTHSGATTQFLSASHTPFDQRLPVPLPRACRCPPAGPVARVEGHDGCDAGARHQAAGAP